MGWCSVNSEYLVNNQKEESLIAQQQIYNKLSAVGGIQNIKVTKNIMYAARNAHWRNLNALQRKEKEDGNEERKGEKERAAEIVKELPARLNFWKLTKLH